MRKILYALASLAAFAWGVGGGWTPYCVDDPPWRGAPGRRGGASRVVGPSA